MQSEKTKHVTNRQGVRLVDFAREAGVSREEFSLFLKDEGKKKKFFDELKNDNNWFEKLQIEAIKIGARVHLLHVKVDYVKNHNEAAMAGGPQTGSDYDVLKVADLYQPSENKVIEEVIVLLNYSQGGGNYQKTMEWGLKNELEKSVPCEIFAIGEQFPKLNYELGPNPMYVVETTGCSFDGDESACYVCWFGAERDSDLRWQSLFGIDGVWFAFRKKKNELKDL